MQYTLLWYIVMIGGCVLALGIGSFIYAIASSECLKRCLSSIGHCANIERNRNISEQLIEFINFQTAIKQLSWHISIEYDIVFRTNFRFSFYLKMCRLFTQSDRYLFGSFSAFFHDCFHVVLDHNMRCTVDDSNGNSLVQMKQKI